MIAQKLESQISKVSVKEKKEEDKAGEKIIVKENIEVGKVHGILTFLNYYIKLNAFKDALNKKVKLDVLLHYFKSCGLWFSIFFVITYILMSVAQGKYLLKHIKLFEFM